MESLFITLTPSQRADIANQIQSQLDAIYGTPRTLSAEAQQRVDEIESIFADYYMLSPQQQTAEKDDELMALNDELSQIYGLRLDSELSPEELTKVADLHSQLAELSACEDRLSPQMQALYDQLDQIFGLPGNLYQHEQDQLAVLKAELDKPVAERQEGASDAQLNAQISEITGVRTFDQLSTEEQTQVNKLHVQIAELAPAEAARLNGEDFANIPVDSMPPVEVVAGFEVSAFEGRDDPAWANIGNPNISQMGEYTFDLEAMMSGGVEHVDEGIYIIGQPVGMDDAVIEVL